MTLLRGTFRSIIPPTPPKWWRAGGASGCIAAYQPKGANDYTESLIDLSMTGNDAAAGTAPDWDRVNGWKFISANTDYLTTGITPTAATTVIVQFSNWTNLAAALWGEFDTTDVTATLSMSRVDNDPPINFRLMYGDNFDDKTDLTSGNYAMAGGNFYLNGVTDGTASGIFAGANANTIFIGATNVGVAVQHADVYIQAFAIYSGTLNATEVKAVAVAMAAL